MAKRSVRISKRDRELYVKLLRDNGEVGFYQKAVGRAMVMAATNRTYDAELLNLSEGFFSLYRSTGNEDFAHVSKVLRRVAHTVYRQLVRKGDKTTDYRFLNLVKG